MMPGRKPNTAGRICALGVCLVAVAGGSGCAGWRLPRIDPTGERVFIWPNETPYGGVVGPPVASAGPTFSPRPPAGVGPPLTTPSGSPPVQTVPGQTALADPSAPPSGNVDAPPVWPDPQAAAVYQNGFAWPASPAASGGPPTVAMPICPPGTIPGSALGLPPPDGVVGPADGPGQWCPWFGGGRSAPPPGMPVLAEPAVPLAAEQIVLSPRRLLAPVGSDVVLRAGICTEEGHLISNQKIEWLLANEGVGEFVDVGEAHWLHPLTRPKKIDNHYAVGRTSGRTFSIQRGTPDPSDDVLVRDGEAWISVTSPIEGTSLVTAVAPEIADWNRRKATTTIYWIDAQWIFPPPTTAATGTQQILTTTVTRRSDGSPLAGWQVRYEILDPGMAGFAPDGAEAVEVMTNGLGQANVEVNPTDAQARSVRIGVQVIRPAMAGSPERLVLGSGTTSVTWSAPEIAIETFAPATAAVGTNATFQINVANRGAAAARETIVTARVPAGMTFVQSQPVASTTDRRIEWRLGDVGPGEQRTISAEYRVERPGSFELCATVQTADGQRSEHCATTQVTTAEPVLDLRVTGPTTAEVGGVAPFEVVVVNRGTAPATGLVITDRFDAGLEHAGDTQRTRQIERALGDLQPGASTQPIAITFTVIAAGRQCHEVEIRGDGGLVVRKSACIEAYDRAGDVTPPLSPQSPPPGAALEVKRDHPRRAEVGGDPVLFKTFVKNTGTVDLQNIVVEETFPRELKPIRTTDGRPPDGRTIRWTITQLRSGERRVFEVEYECLAATDLAGACTSSTASVGNLVRAAEACVEILPPSRAPDVSPPGGAETRPAPPADAAAPNLDLQIAEFGDPVSVGQRATYIITITNKGQASDRAVVLEVAFPPEMTPDVNRINQTLRNQAIQASVQGQALRFSPIAEIRANEPIVLTLSFNLNRPGVAKLVVRVTSENLSRALTKEEETEIVPR